MEYLFEKNEVASKTLQLKKSWELVAELSSLRHPFIVSKSKRVDGVRKCKMLSFLLHDKKG